MNKIQMSLIILGVVGVGVVGLVLSNEKEPTHKVIETSKLQEKSETQTHLAMLENKDESSSFIDQNRINSTDHDESYEEDNSVLSTEQSIQEKRLEVTEQHKDESLLRREYKQERRKWRKELNAALKEAKLTGDYSQYEAIKRLEPGKTW